MNILDVAAFTALGWETRAVLGALGDVRPADGPRRWYGRLGNGGSCLVVQTGMGPARAAAAARVTPAARALVVLGCAGGLVPWLHTGDIVVATEVVRLGWACRPEARAPATAVAATFLGAHAGAVVSSTTVLSTTVEKTAAAGCGALVVDMESWTLAAEAQQRRVPFAAVRVVLDIAADDLPALGGAIDVETGELDPWRAAGALLPRPWIWPAVARIARQQREAERQLAAVAARLLRCGPSPAWQGEGAPAARSL